MLKSFFLCYPFYIYKYSLHFFSNYYHYHFICRYPVYILLPCQYLMAYLSSMMPTFFYRAGLLS